MISTVTVMFLVEIFQMSVWTIATVVIKVPASISWPQNFLKSSASVILDGLERAAVEVKQFNYKQQMHVHAIIYQ